MNAELNIDDFDDDELSPSIRAQLERLEVTQRGREHQRMLKNRRILKLRRSIEDRTDERRMRDEIDYLI